MLAPRTVWWLGTLFLVCAPVTSAGGQDSAPAAAADTAEIRSPGAPVVLYGDTLFFVRARLGPFSPQARAAATEERLRRLSGDLLTRFDSAVAEDNGGSTDVIGGDLVLFTVTDADADSAGTTRLALATERARMITSVVRARAPGATVKILLIGAALTVLASIVALLLFRALGWLFTGGIRRLRSWRGTRIPAIRVRNYELFSSSQITEFLVGVLRWIRAIAVLVLGYVYVSLVFSFFPWTRGVAGQLLGWVLDPLARIGLGFAEFVPKAFFIVVIIVVTRYVLKVIHGLFNGIGSGRLVLANFPPDWAEPTYKLVRILVVAFAVVMIFPYLPGSHSDAFKGVSVFIGLLLSLGSSGAIANLVAGVVITYMRPFRVGDRVRIADTTGDVMDKTLLVTRIRTIKNEDITIPNSMVLSSHIVNFSSSARDLGLILHTKVTIGYDAPWRQVHELLLAAADATEGVVKEPKPYVLQTSLDDFYVSYELNAFTDQPNAMAALYSRLHQNIQDQFNEAGVEIMSPHYGALRDGNEVTVPASYRPANYQAQRFRVDGSSA